MSAFMEDSNGAYGNSEVESMTTASFPYRICRICSINWVLTKSEENSSKLIGVCDECIKTNGLSETHVKSENFSENDSCDNSNDKSQDEEDSESCETKPITYSERHVTDNLREEDKCSDDYDDNPILNINNIHNISGSLNTDEHSQINPTLPFHSDVKLTNGGISELLTVDYNTVKLNELHVNEELSPWFLNDKLMSITDTSPPSELRIIKVESLALNDNDNESVSVNTCRDDMIALEETSNNIIIKALSDSSLNKCVKLEQENPSLSAQHTSVGAAVEQCLHISPEICVFQDVFNQTVSAPITHCTTSAHTTASHHNDSGLPNLFQCSANASQVVLLQDIANQNLSISAEWPQTTLAVAQQQAVRVAQDIDQHLEIQALGPLTHACSICHLRFSHRQELMKHKQLHRPDPSEKCGICQEKCNTEILLHEHYRRKHFNRVGQVFTCTLCSYSCKPFASFVSHVRLHTSERPYVCSQCGQCFIDVPQLFNHAKYAHPGVSRQAVSSSQAASKQTKIIAFTPNTTSTRAAVTEELVSVTKAKDQYLRSSAPEPLTHACSICCQQFAERREMMDHEQLHRPDPSGTCGLCTETFQSDFWLGQHCQWKHRDITSGLYSCTFCLYTTKFLNIFVIHARLHAGEMPYVCTQCEKRYMSRRELIAHIKSTHQNERYHIAHSNQQIDLTSEASLHGSLTHACSICWQWFAGSMEMLEHEQLHRPDPRETCGICLEAFDTESLLWRHCRSIHRDESNRFYTCSWPMCPYMTIDIRRFVNHARLHSGEKPYACTWCEHRCTSRGRLIEHKRRSHRNMMNYSKTFSTQPTALVTKVHQAISQQTASVTEAVPLAHHTIESSAVQLPVTSHRNEFNVLKVECSVPEQRENDSSSIIDYDPVNENCKDHHPSVTSFKFQYTDVSLKHLTPDLILCRIDNGFNSRNACSHQCLFCPKIFQHLTALASHECTHTNISIEGSMSQPTDFAPPTVSQHTASASETSVSDSRLHPITTQATSTSATLAGQTLSVVVNSCGEDNISTEKAGNNIRIKALSDISLDKCVNLEQEMTSLSAQYTSVDTAVEQCLHILPETCVSQDLFNHNVSASVAHCTTSVHAAASQQNNSGLPILLQCSVNPSQVVSLQDIANQDLPFSAVAPQTTFAGAQQAVSVAHDMDERLETQVRGPLTYGCSICRERFSHRTKLMEHKQLHRPDLSENCGICQKKCNTELLLRKHYRWKHFNRVSQRFNCTFCSYSCKLVAYFVNHVRLHTRERPYTCTQCGQCFIDVPQLFNHVKYAHPDVLQQPVSASQAASKQTILAITPQKTSTLAAVTEELVSVNEAVDQYLRSSAPEPLAHACSICCQQFAERREMMNHEQLHRPDPSGKCGICKETFETDYLLREHCQWKHRDRLNLLYSCSLCLYTTTCVDIFIGHVLLHAGELPYVCTLCEKRYMSRLELIAHIKSTHQNERYHMAHSNQPIDLTSETSSHGSLTHACSICRQWFAGSMEMLVHERLHRPDPREMCGICLEAFDTESLLWRHCRSFHRDESSRLFICSWPTCPYTTRHIKALINHARYHRGVRPYACTWCEHRYTTRGGVIHHIRYAHQNKMNYSKTFSAQLTALATKVHQAIPQHTASVTEAVPLAHHTIENSSVQLPVTSHRNEFNNLKVECSVPEQRENDSSSTIDYDPVNENAEADHHPSETTFSDSRLHPITTQATSTSASLALQTLSVVVNSCGEDIISTEKAGNNIRNKALSDISLNKCVKLEQEMTSPSAQHTSVNTAVEQCLHILPETCVSQDVFNRNVSASVAQVVSLQDIANQNLPFSAVAPQTTFAVAQQAVSVAHDMNERSETQDSGLLTYGCSICHLRFISRVELMEHKQLHRPELSEKCGICQETCKTELLLRKHYRRKHFKRDSHVFICTLCSYSCKPVASFVSHVRLHTSERPYVCTQCEQGFIDVPQLFNHVKYAHPSVPQQAVSACQAASQQTLIAGTLLAIIPQTTSAHAAVKQELISVTEAADQYLRTSAPEPLAHACSICCKQFAERREMMDHEQLHRPDPSGKCGICKETFQTDYLLREHCQWKHRDKLNLLYSCSLCLYTTTCVDIFVSHVLLHAGELPYVCTQCDKQFTSRSGLITHIKSTHHREIYDIAHLNQQIDLTSEASSHGSLTHACSICGQRFAGSIELLEHERLHRPNLSEKCGICQETCDTEFILQEHYRWKHFNSVEQVFSCTFCVYSCKSVTSFVSHVRLHTGERPVCVCTLCGKCYINVPQLIYHVKSAHPSVSEQAVSASQAVPRETDDSRLQPTSPQTTSTPAAFEQQTLGVSEAADKYLETFSQGTGTLTHTCFICWQSFAGTVELIEHEQRHRPDPTEQCGICQETFDTESLLLRHCWSIHRNKASQLYTCSLLNCHYTTKCIRRLVNHARWHSGVMPYACTQCEHRCSSREQLIEHIGRSHQNKNKTFSTQPSAFVSRVVVQLAPPAVSQEMIDSRLQPIASQATSTPVYIAPETLSVSQAADKYLKTSSYDPLTHAGSKRFDGSIEFMENKQLHRPDPREKCGFCPETFDTEWLLRSHYRSIHRDESTLSYTCSWPSCPYKTKDIRRFFSHARLHSAEKPYECTHCAQRYTTRGHLIQHQRHAHQNKTMYKKTLTTQPTVLASRVHQAISQQTASDTQSVSLAHHTIENSVQFTALKTAAQLPVTLHQYKLLNVIKEEYSLPEQRENDSSSTIDPVNENPEDYHPSETSIKVQYADVTLRHVTPDLILCRIDDSFNTRKPCCHQCRVCPKIFQRATALARHEQTHNDRSVEGKISQPTDFSTQTVSQQTASGFQAVKMEIVSTPQCFTQQMIVRRPQASALCISPAFEHIAPKTFYSVDVSEAVDLHFNMSLQNKFARSNNIFHAGQQTVATNQDKINVLKVDPSLPLKKENESSSELDDDSVNDNPSDDHLSTANMDAPYTDISLKYCTPDLILSRVDNLDDMEKSCCHQCRICPKIFRRVTALARHERTHPYVGKILDGKRWDREQRFS